MKDVGDLKLIFSANGKKKNDFYLNTASDLCNDAHLMSTYNVFLSNILCFSVTGYTVCDTVFFF